MLKFFRNIRHSLIQSSSGKYILYAIGEILLVVIGILIALQINNWNEENKDNFKLKEYTETLISDIVEDTLMIFTSVSNVPNRLKELGAYLQFVENGNITSNQLLDSLEKVSVRFNYFIPTTTTYEDLKSTGNFSLFRKEKRKVIIEYYKFLDWFIKVFENSTRAQEQESLELRKHYSNHFYKALNYKLSEEKFIQGIKHRHNLVEIEKGKVDMIKVFGPEIMEKARNLIKYLKED
jgi:hypothetical protein